MELPSDNVSAPNEVDYLGSLTMVAHEVELMGGIQRYLEQLERDSQTHTNFHEAMKVMSETESETNDRAHETEKIRKGLGAGALTALEVARCTFPTAVTLSHDDTFMGIEYDVMRNRDSLGKLAAVKLLECCDSNSPLGLSINELPQSYCHDSFRLGLGIAWYSIEKRFKEAKGMQVDGRIAGDIREEILLGVGDAAGYLKVMAEELPEVNRMTLQRLALYCHQGGYSHRSEGRGGDAYYWGAVLGVQFAEKYCEEKHIDIGVIHEKWRDEPPHARLRREDKPCESDRDVLLGFQRDGLSVDMASMAGALTKNLEYDEAETSAFINGLSYVIESYKQTTHRHMGEGAAMPTEWRYSQGLLKPEEYRRAALAIEKRAGNSDEIDDYVGDLLEPTKHELNEVAEGIGRRAVLALHEKEGTALEDIDGAVEEALHYGTLLGFELACGAHGSKEAPTSDDVRLGFELIKELTEDTQLAARSWSELDKEMEKFGKRGLVLGGQETELLLKAWEKRLMPDSDKAHYMRIGAGVVLYAIQCRQLEKKLKEYLENPGGDADKQNHPDH